MAQKEYLKMADVFDGVVSTSLIDDESINEMARGDGAGDYHVLQDDAYWMLIDKDHAEYAAHAINSHDELVAEVERLRELTENAFLDGCEAGFALSAEGVNGEYNVVSYESMMDRFKSALDEYKKGL